MHLSKTPKYRQKYQNMKELGYEFLVPAEPSRRRIRALQVIGYSLTDQAARLGITQQRLSNVLHDNASVRPATARRIAALYDELHMTPAPDDYYTRRTRLRAQRLGYAGPLAWDDIDHDYEPQGVKA